MKHDRFWPETAPEVAEAAVAGLDRYGSVVFKIGMLRLDGDASQRLAYRIAGELRDELIRSGAPKEMRLEIDVAQESPLPHGSSQPASYLTPSVLDQPDWDPAWRTFPGCTAHTMYQGIFSADPGEALSATTYYDWLRILHDVKAARFMGNDNAPSTASWLGDNLGRAVRTGRAPSLAYPTLGLTETALLAAPLLRCGRPVAAELKDRFPLLRTLSTTCPCRDCGGEVTRVFCNLASLTIGLTWPQFRSRYEVQVPVERFDLLIAHNLTTLRGCWGRVVEPLRLVLDTPSGPEYEAWLSRAWRRLDA
ncbi:hypothetical protein [Acrocarpospora macrocephala]|nr:hypothetical protein [Acrocarpospora macrocephala]